VLRGRIGEGDAKRKIEALKMIASALMIFKAEDYLKRGFDIALKEKITVYDAMYIALAEDKARRSSRATGGSTTSPRGT